MAIVRIPKELRESSKVVLKELPAGTRLGREVRGGIMAAREPELRHALIAVVIRARGRSASPCGDIVDSGLGSWWRPSRPKESETDAEAAGQLSTPATRCRPCAMSRQRIKRVLAARGRPQSLVEGNFRVPGGTRGASRSPRLGGPRHGRGSIR